MARVGQEMCPVCLGCCKLFDTETAEVELCPRCRGNGIVPVFSVVHGARKNPDEVGLPVASSNGGGE
jgi:hypothetical protein